LEKEKGAASTRTRKQKTTTRSKRQRPQKKSKTKHRRKKTETPINAPLLPKTRSVGFFLDSNGFFLFYDFQQNGSVENH